MLAVLFGTPERSFYANEVIALAQSGTGAVQRELAALSSAGLLNVTRQGNQKHYQANAQAPIFAELRGLVLKTIGLADVLRAALLPLAARIEMAFVYGSVAKQQDTAHSDIDLMLVSDTLTYGDTILALQNVSAQLGREVNPNIFTPQDFAKRLREGGSFVSRVMAQPKVWLIGGPDDLAL